VTQATALEWGHPLLTPDGREIRVPLSAFGTLRKLGVLQKNKNRLNDRIYELIDPQYDSITEGLRHLLGDDLSGPKWCSCGCRECQGKASELDDSRLSKMRVNQIISEIRRRRPR
jgi:hypothetical protein